MYIKKKKFISTCLVVLFAVFSSFIDYTNINYNGFISIVGSLVLVFWIIILFKVRKNTGYFIMSFFIFYINVSVVVGCYFIPSIRPFGLYQQITDDSVYMKGLMCVFWFSLIFLLLMISNVNSEKIELTKELNIVFRGNSIIAIVCYLIVILLFLLFFRSGAEGERATTISPILEYRIIFIIIGMLYTKDTKRNRLIWLSLILCTAAIVFNGGNRADTIPQLIAYFYVYHRKISYKWVLGLLFGAIVFMTAIGIVRGGGISALNGVGTLNIMTNSMFVADTATFAYFPSLEAINISNMIPVATKAVYFWGQVVYVFIGGSFGKYHLNELTSEYALHYNGFVAPLYFYFWFGFLGVVIFSVLVFKITTYVFTSKADNSYWKNGIFIYVVTTVTRWYLYNPLLIFRGSIYMFLCMAIALVFDNYIRKGTATFSL